jgi:hypothetical protein
MLTLDLRKPLGILFILLGVLLAGYGIAVPGAHAEVISGLNVNLIWGSTMGVSGGLLLVFTLRK